MNGSTGEGLRGPEGGQQPGQGHETRFLRQRRRAQGAVNHHGGVPFAAGILLGIIGRLQIIENGFHDNGSPTILAGGIDLLPHLYIAHIHRNTKGPVKLGVYILAIMFLTVSGTVLVEGLAWGIIIRLIGVECRVWTGRNILAGSNGGAAGIPEFNRLGGGGHGLFGSQQTRKPAGAAVGGKRTLGLFVPVAGRARGSWTPPVGTSLV